MNPKVGDSCNICFSCIITKVQKSFNGPVGTVGCASDWRAGGRGFDARLGKLTVWLCRLTVFDMIPIGLHGRKTAHTNKQQSFITIRETWLQISHCFDQKFVKISRKCHNE